MSTILVDNIKSFSGTSVTVSGSNITVQGDTAVQGHFTASGNVTLGNLILDKIVVDGQLTSSYGMFITGGDFTVAGGLSNNATLDVGTVQIGRTANVGTLDKIELRSQTTASKGMFITGGDFNVAGGLSNNATLDVGNVQIGRTDTGTGTIALISQTTASNGLIVSGTNSHLQLDGDIIAPNIPKVQPSDHPTLSGLLSGEFYTMSGSQLFSASAFIDPSRPAATVQPFVSASLFVFRKA